MLYSPTAPRAELDMTLFWSVVLLLSLGLVMVYSSSIAMAEAEKMTGYRMHYFLMRHSFYLVVGVVAAGIAFQIPIAFWQKMALPLFIIGTVMLILVLVPGIGLKVNGSRRWLSLVFITAQPSELMKFLVVLYAADYTVRKAAFMHDFRKGFLPMAAVMVLTGALLLMEPDYGALVVITAIAMAVLFLGGLNWRVFAGLVVLLSVSFVVMIVTSPYRMQRLASYMDPWADAFGKGYQLSHSLIAFGRGQWLGVGLGGSVEKLFYLPEAHTDFLLAVIAEELGLLGITVVLGLFALLIYRAFAVGREAMMREKYFPALVAQGIGVWLAVQGFINMGVNMGLLPTKGLTLPFLSYGGTGIVVNCVAVAVLLRIDAENRAGAKTARKGVGRA
ncbi:MAG: putative lipid II flippase FtsW [Usitatibacteraceae bacterium]